MHPQVGAPFTQTLSRITRSIPGDQAWKAVQRDLDWFVERVGGRKIWFSQVGDGHSLMRGLFLIDINHKERMAIRHVPRGSAEQSGCRCQYY